MYWRPEGPGPHSRIALIRAGIEQPKGCSILDSSMVEHSAVNRRVAGSSPARGVFRSFSSVG